MVIPYLEFENKSGHRETKKEVKKFLRACENNDIETVRQMVEEVGISVNPGYVENSWVPLTAALWNKSEDVVDYLLENDAEMMSDIDFDNELLEMREEALELELWVLKKMCCQKPNLSGEIKYMIFSRLLEVDDQTLTGCFVNRFPNKFWEYLVYKYFDDHHWGRKLSFDDLKKWVVEFVILDGQMNLKLVKEDFMINHGNAVKYLKKIETIVSFLDGQNVISRADYGPYLRQVDTMSMAVSDGLVKSYEELRDFLQSINKMSTKVML